LNPNRTVVINAIVNGFSHDYLPLVAQASRLWLISLQIHESLFF
jgi:hypothetical protein